MDSITTIAIASIITAGITTALGCMMPAHRGRQGRIFSLKFHCATARCRTHHYPNIICRTGHDRIHRDILFRGFDDPHFRQSFLESRPRQLIPYGYQLVHRNSPGH